ncbi:1,4-dihydroxy-2-naphthoate polyprenyltransferase [Gleimia sp. 6138-11-ORH1]|uniref:1,4-dihydroxy-2-naphthoate polyprenyltransferase n=1 Tax=Gleimia sp. 6138-11-ORH1 TaxID=2973937 RepID=UPI00216A357F|nr:1,4-dihydroxy-2-naphthoate polyprenyltransferase [Gleimia sp. 6138-11-ORH1]MCS4483882.1 1,4-dihydroxy-2-naphthoate polyprenyltransferase [Gleimia sp. 6138-11-ORH1]
MSELNRQVSLQDWLEGARLRTLPAAVAPVLIGIGAADRLGGLHWGLSVLALLVALALQIGVNFSNDYSDGIRGTDDARSGPLRLTASGLVSPKTVLFVALACFAFAGLTGLVILFISGQWVLLLPGVLAVVAAWFYTGGKTPYGYAGVGLSELFVFVFFGLMATVGTTWVQVQQAPLWLWLAASGVGFLSVALLFINNIRDIPTDSQVGKRTVAVRLGDRVSRLVCQGLIGAGLLLGLLSLPLSLPLAFYWVSFLLFGSVFILLVQNTLPSIVGAGLLPALRNLGVTTLLFGFVISLGYFLS